MRFLRRLAYWLRPRSQQAELTEELALHRDLLECELRARGLAPADARDAARRAMGNETYMREESRRIWTWPWADSLGQDLRYGWRALCRSPAFTIVAVLSLGVGIGANTAIFGLIHAVLLARLPVAHPEQLVAPHRRVARGRPNDQFSRAEFEALRSGPVDLALFASSSSTVEIGTVQDDAGVDAVDGHYFELIGVRAQRGRLLSPSDAAAGAPVAVISDRLWRGRMNADPGAVGRVIKIRRQPFTIVGITPPGFSGVRFPGLMQITIPYGAARAIGIVQSDDLRAQQATIIGRLKPHQSIDQAQGMLAVLFNRCCAEGELMVSQNRPPGRSQLELVDVSRGIPHIKVDIRGQYGRILFALMGGVAVLLLVACANVGNLLLARAAARQRELAVRLSLGATRGRLASQLIVESIELSLLGALVGLALARWGTSALIHANVAFVSETLTLTPNPTILIFTAVVSIACGVLFGALPSLRLTRTDLVTPLKEGGRRWRGRHAGALDRALVAVQLAFALLLVSAATLLGRTLRNLQNVELNFAPAPLLVLSVETRGTAYESQKMTIQMAADVLRNVRAIPGVRSAGLGSQVPMFGGRSSFEKITVAGGAPIADDDAPVGLTAVTADYFASASIPIRAGRDLTSQDGGVGEGGAVVNEAFVKRFFAGREPLGQTFHLNNASGPAFRVVGVVADVRYVDLRAPAEPMYYIPVTDGQWPFLVLMVRAAGDPAALAPAVSRAIASAAPGAAQSRLTTMQSAIDAVLARERLAATLAGLFGVIALGLAALGLYGVMAYQVTGRTVEIGIRMALGARSSTVMWLVLRQSLKVVGIGLIAGLPLAVLSGRSIASQLYGVTPYSVGALGAAVAVLVAVGVAASLLPARRAVTVDPLVALRAD